MPMKFLVCGSANSILMGAGIFLILVTFSDASIKLLCRTPLRQGDVRHPLPPRPHFRPYLFSNDPKSSRRAPVILDAKPDRACSALLPMDGGLWHLNGTMLSAVKQRGRERKGTPEITQKFRSRNWPISSADLPMTLMEAFLGAISSGPLFSRPLWFTADAMLSAHWCARE